MLNAEYGRQIAEGSHVVCTEYLAKASEVIGSDPKWSEGLEHSGEAETCRNFAEKHRKHRNTRKRWKKLRNLRNVSGRSRR